MIKKNKKKFNYLEIGSFLGGSLTPFLSEKKCQLVMSIDKETKNKMMKETKNGVTKTLMKKIWSMD